MSLVGNEADLAKSLSGRRVLVTGHTGFKGGWMCMWLSRLGAEVVGVSLPAPEESFCEAVKLETVVDSRIGDVRSAEGLRSAVGGEDFDLVIHMAAQALVRASYDDPVDTYLTNVVGTAVVLDAARRMPSLKAAVVVTSDKCYANNEWVWGYREHDPMGGKDPYSSSKGCAELVASAYRSSYFSDPAGPQLATVRAGNVIGGGDWSADRLVPDLVRALESGIPARLRNPSNVRPWQHVLEPVRGYLMLAARLMDAGPSYAGAWNFGCDRDAALSVAGLADLVAGEGHGRGPVYVIEAEPDAPKEAVLLRLDSTKSFVELGWKPLFAIDEAVSKTVEWYRRYREDASAIRRFTENQIVQYADAWGGGGTQPQAADRPWMRVAACA